MASNNKTPHKDVTVRYCAFCGRNEDQVNFLIPSPSGVYICDFCVEACADLIFENTETATESATFASS